MIQRTLAIWSLVPLPLQRPNCTSVSSQFTYRWSLAWRILSITLLTCEHKWAHLYGSLNVLCRCPLGLKWELAFSSPVATAAVVVGWLAAQWTGAPGSSVPGISQARVLGWVAISFSRGSFPPRDQAHISHIAGEYPTAELPKKPSGYCWIF